MNRFSRIEYLLLNYLYSKETGIADAPLLETGLELQEKDEINKIREIVFYIEKLEREGFLETDPGFYTESDHMSFTYLNSAVELNEEAVRLSEEGRQLVISHMGSGEAARFVSAYRRIIETPETRTVLTTTGIGLFALGALAGFLAGRVL